MASHSLRKSNLLLTISTLRRTVDLLRERRNGDPPSNLEPREIEYWRHSLRFNTSSFLYALGEALEAAEEYLDAAEVYQEAIHTMDQGLIIPSELDFYTIVYTAWGLR